MSSDARVRCQVCASLPCLCRASQHLQRQPRHRPQPLSRASERSLKLLDSGREMSQRGQQSPSAIPADATRSASTAPAPASGALRDSSVARCSGSLPYCLANRCRCRRTTPLAPPGALRRQLPPQRAAPLSKASRAIPMSPQQLAEASASLPQLSTPVSGTGLPIASAPLHMGSSLAPPRVTSIPASAPSTVSALGPQSDGAVADPSVSAAPAPAVPALSAAYTHRWHHILSVLRFCPRSQSNGPRQHLPGHPSRSLCRPRHPRGSRSRRHLLHLESRSRRLSTPTRFFFRQSETRSPHARLRKLPSGPQTWSTVCRCARANRPTGLWGYV